MTNKKMNPNLSPKNNSNKLENEIFRKYILTFKHYWDKSIRLYSNNEFSLSIISLQKTIDSLIDLVIIENLVNEKHLTLKFARKLIRKDGVLNLQAKYNGIFLEIFEDENLHFLNGLWKYKISNINHQYFRIINGQKIKDEKVSNKIFYDAHSAIVEILYLAKHEIHIPSPQMNEPS